MFASRARLGSMTTRWRDGPVKKAAEHAALWDLLDLIGGHVTTADPTTPPAPPEPQLTAPVIESLKEGVAPIPSESAGSWNPVALASALGTDETQYARRQAKALADPVDWLTTLATSIGVGELHVDTLLDGPPHDRRFTVTLTAGPVTGTATDTTIKTARTAAAHAAITDLFDHPPTMPTAARPQRRGSNTPIALGDVTSPPRYPSRHRRAATRGETWATVQSPSRHLSADSIPACTRDPDAWFPNRLPTASAGAGQAEMAECRRCPIQQGCARAALDDSTRLNGIWAGVYIPPPASASQKTVRETALEQLRNIAYPDSRSEDR